MCNMANLWKPVDKREIGGLMSGVLIVAINNSKIHIECKDAHVYI